MNKCIVLLGFGKRFDTDTVFENIIEAKSFNIERLSGENTTKSKRICYTFKCEI